VVALRTRGAVKLPVVGSLPLIEAPPLIMLPDVPHVPVVAVAVELAVVGPTTWVCLTVTVIPLTLMPLPLQTANAAVVLPVPLMPPFNATAVQEVGLVLPSAAALPELLEGRLAMSLTLMLLANVDCAPPRSRRVFAGQVAVVWSACP
jgi:hypothetical protein